MKVLFAGFKGINNPSKILLDKITGDKLYLDNDYTISEKQLLSRLKDYETVFIFGKKPSAKSICIEIKSKINEIEYFTNYNYLKFLDNVKQANIKVRLSDKPGNSLCNNIYFKSLEYINKNDLQTSVLFIHLPTDENILQSISKIVVDIYP